MEERIIELYIRTCSKLLYEKNMILALIPVKMANTTAVKKKKINKNKC